MSLTEDPNDPRLGFGTDKEAKGQNDAYLVQPQHKAFVRPVRRSYTHNTCGAVTTMHQRIAETYAQDPSFYGSTFCSGCQKHLPVGEFRWTDDGQRVGS